MQDIPGRIKACPFSERQQDSLLPKGAEKSFADFSAPFQSLNGIIKLSASESLLRLSGMGNSRIFLNVTVQSNQIFSV